MGKRIIISEVERKHINGLYGLINEQEIKDEHRTKIKNRLMVDLEKTYIDNRGFNHGGNLDYWSDNNYSFKTLTNKVDDYLKYYEDTVYSELDIDLPLETQLEIVKELFPKYVKQKHSEKIKRVEYHEAVVSLGYTIRRLLTPIHPKYNPKGELGWLTMWNTNNEIPELNDGAAFKRFMGYMVDELDIFNEEDRLSDRELLDVIKRIYIDTLKQIHSGKLNVLDLIFTDELEGIDMSKLIREEVSYFKNEPGDIRDYYDDIVYSIANQILHKGQIIDDKEEILQDFIKERYGNYILQVIEGQRFR